MIDSNSLKSVNDEFGRQAGNRLLKMLVQYIQAHMRKTHVVARYGGDEFIVLLPENSPGAEKMAMRVRERERVETAVMTTRDKQTAPPSAPESRATLSTQTISKALRNKPTRRFIQAKRAARNRVTVAPTPAYVAAAARYLR
jgi:diguanylate cyclase (GGDEF)-like protein